MTKRKLTLRCISIILCLAMILGSSQLVVTAEEYIESSEAINENNTNETATQEGLIEDISLRDKFTKHYVDEDGTRYAVIFPEQVHYEDADGEWVEVDNTLTYDSATSRYVSENEVFSTSFASSATSGDLVSVTDGDYTMSWSLSFAGTGNMQMSATATAQIVNGGASISEIKTVDNMKNMGKAASSVRYSSVWGVADVRYSIAHGRVEEDIILNSRGGFTSYMMTVNTGGLTATKCDDGSVTFSNSEGETIFTIDAPWMMDAAAKYSDDIEVEVLQRGDTAYVIYAPSVEWLNDTERVYPVLIDPSFTTRYYTSNYEDTYVASHATDTSFYNAPTLIVGNDFIDKYYGYVKILNFPELNNVSVSDISFDIYTSDVHAAYSMDVHLVRSSWSENTISYSNMPSDTDLLSDVDPMTGDVPGLVRYSFDLTDAIPLKMEQLTNHISVFDFFNDSTEWFGFKLEYNNPEDVGYSPINIFSSENTSDFYRPTLTIEYSLVSPDGITDGAVYSFRNAASGKYLTVDSTDASNFSNVYQYTGSDSLAQSFCISYNDTETGYTIRTLCDAGGGYGKSLEFWYPSTIIESGANSGYVPQNVYLYTYSPDTYADCQEWYIEPCGSNTYKILSRADPDLALTAYGTSNGTASGTTSTSAGNVYVSEFVSGNSAQLWTLVEDSRYVDIGDTSAIDCYEGDSVSLFHIDNDLGNVSSISWSSSNTSVASVDADGNVTANAIGEATITATVIQSAGSTNVYTCTVYVCMEDGVYYFRNAEHTGYYMQIDDDVQTWMDSGAKFELWGFDGNLDQQWRIQYVGQGYYKISSVTNGLPISVPSGSESTECVDLIQEAYTGADRQKWKITLTSSGTYKFSPKSQPAMYMAAGISSNDEIEEINIEQRYNLSDQSEEWYLYGHKDYTLMYIGYQLGDPEMPPILNSVEIALKTQANMDGYGYTSLTKSELLVHLASTSIFSCITHGDNSSITTTDGSLTIDDINSLDSNAFDDLVFVYFGACETGTGKNNETNLVNSVYNKGADAVLGFTIEVFVGETNSWTKTFMRTLATGTTISEAMSAADAAVKDDPNVVVPYYSTGPDYRYMCGSDQLIPCD